MKALALALALFLLAGCASGPSHHQLGQQALHRGDLPAAEQQLRHAISTGETTAWNDLGVVYSRTNRQALAVDAFRMSARYGDPAGKANLSRRNLPIPAADLLKAEESDSAVIGGGMKTLVDGYRGNQTTCTTLLVGDTLARTTCK
jgi:hypothetical protein